MLYLVKSTGHLSQEDYSKALELLPEGGEKIMETLADQWKQQGKEEVLLEKPYWEQQARLENTKETLIDVATEQYGPLPVFLLGSDHNK